MEYDLTGFDFPEYINAVPSKSELHRLLLCAALSKRETVIPCAFVCEDTAATIRCLRALGTDIGYDGTAFYITPAGQFAENALCDCGDSGTTLRLLLPVVCGLGLPARFGMSEQLAARPLSPLIELLTEGGAEIRRDGNAIAVCGKCRKTRFSVPGNVSSQFISGLALMLTLSGGEITITGRAESRPYIEMTADVLRKFGCRAAINGNVFTVEKRSPLHTPGKIIPSGDWSWAAVYLTAGVIGRHPVSVAGLDENSVQGDKAIVSVLRGAGAKIVWYGDTVTAFPSRLSAFTADVSDTPDIVPALAAAAMNAEGNSAITGAARLRFKESDRMNSVKNVILSLGGSAETDENNIYIKGTGVKGGTVRGFHDHRIVTAAACAAASSDGRVTVTDAEAVGKSYPGFFEK